MLFGRRPSARNLLFPDLRYVNEPMPVYRTARRLIRHCVCAFAEPAHRQSHHAGTCTSRIATPRAYGAAAQAA